MRIPVLVYETKLSRHPDCINSIFIIGNCRMWLNRCMYHTMRCIVFRICKCRISEFFVCICTALTECSHSHIVRIRCTINPRCAIFHCLKRIKYCRQIFIFNFDQINRFLCSLLVNGRYCRNIVTDSSYFIRTEHFTISKFYRKLRITKFSRPFEICCSQDCLYTRKLLCLTGINRKDLGMRSGRTHHLCSQHIRKHNISGILATSGYFIFSIDFDIVVATCQAIKFRLLKKSFVTIFMHLFRLLHNLCHLCRCCLDRFYNLRITCTSAQITFDRFTYFQLCRMRILFQQTFC